MSQEISELYVKFRRPLLRFIRYKVGDSHTAEDLLHEVFIKAGSSLGGLKEGKKIQNWLFAIASNTVSDYFRKHTLPLTDGTDVAVEEVLSSSVMEELSCCLGDFLATLPDAQREVLRSLYVQERTHDEYARAHDMNLSTVKSHARRGKLNLKKLLEECCRFETNARGEMVGFSPNPVGVSMGSCVVKRCSDGGE